MSTIEWTDKTWNPTKGCSKVSPGCTNCYAIRMAHRLQAIGHDSYQQTTKRQGGKTQWTGKVNIDEKTLVVPLSWKKPYRIFVNSMSDLFHESISEDYLLRIWKIMEQANHHQFQILTKRPERMQKVLSNAKFFPVLDNVWLGVSVESADYLERLDSLRITRAAVRFVSFEPLLGSVYGADLTDIDWAIIGGESGPRARLMREEWVDEIRQACLISGTAFFFKQWGNWGSDGIRRHKKANGRIFKGNTWDAFPQEIVL